MCGTIEYLAPELYTNSEHVTRQIDMWSLGVILFIMLSGYAPFSQAAAEQAGMHLAEQVRRGKYTFFEKEWSSVSSEAKNLVQSLLQINPKQRLTAQQCVKHPWVALPRITHNDEDGTPQGDTDDEQQGNKQETVVEEDDGVIFEDESDPQVQEIRTMADKEKEEMEKEKAFARQQKAIEKAERQHKPEQVRRPPANLPVPAAPNMISAPNYNNL